MRCRKTVSDKGRRAFQGRIEAYVRFIGHVRASSRKTPDTMQRSQSAKRRRRDFRNKNNKRFNTYKRVKNVAKRQAVFKNKIGAHFRRIGILKNTDKPSLQVSSENRTPSAHKRAKAVNKASQGFSRDKFFQGTKISIPDTKKPPKQAVEQSRE